MQCLINLFPKYFSEKPLKTGAVWKQAKKDEGRIYEARNPIKTLLSIDTPQDAHYYTG